MKNKKLYFNSNTYYNSDSAYYNIFERIVHYSYKHKAIVIPIKNNKFKSTLSTNYFYIKEV